MGSAITELMHSEPLRLEDLQGKIIAIDAYNMLYQFLTTIRMRDGTPLKDSKGNITSHLIGLFSRATKLMEKGLKLVFVFDGEPPELKKKELERRRKIKEDATVKLAIATKSEDVDGMRKFAGRTSKLTKEMAAEAMQLLNALGIPCVQAPSEGEAQAAYMVKKGDAYAVASQDADALLFGATRVIKNLNIAGKRKQSGTQIYRSIQPELIKLSETLNALGMTREQLIALAMLVGTDYHIGGINGLGPKKARKQITLHGENLEELFAAVRWEEETGLPWKTVFEQFTKIEVSDEYNLRWGGIDEDTAVMLLVEKHDFSAERVKNTLEKLQKSNKHQQKGLGEFFS